jgi:hypothetical protein
MKNHVFLIFLNTGCVMQFYDLARESVLQELEVVPFNLVRPSSALITRRHIPI